MPKLPEAVPQTSPRHLVVSVDTEEEGLWGGRFDAHPTTKNLRGLPRFQEFCESLGVTPTYLIAAPVVMDDWAVERLRTWQDAGRCEVGAHCHPWCNPPLDGKPSTSTSSYLCNLDAEVQRRKLEWLTERIEQALGRRPTSFRAGRYGLDHVGAGILADLGYTVDSSVLPYRDYSDQGGPDFREATGRVYRINESNLLEADRNGRLLEIPVTSGYSRPGFAWRNRLRRLLTDTPLRRFRIAGLLDRLNVLRLVKLSPEQADFKTASLLIDSALSEHLEVLVVMLHSSSLSPGFSPYVKNDADLDDFYQRLGRMVSYCIEEKQCEAIILRDVLKTEVTNH